MHGPEFARRELGVVPLQRHPAEHRVRLAVERIDARRCARRPGGACAGSVTPASLQQRRQPARGARRCRSRRRARPSARRSRGRGPSSRARSPPSARAGCRRRRRSAPARRRARTPASPRPCCRPFAARVRARAARGSCGDSRSRACGARRSAPSRAATSFGTTSALLQGAERPLDVLVEADLQLIEVGVEHFLERSVGVEAVAVRAHQLVQAASARTWSRGDRRRATPGSRRCRSASDPGTRRSDPSA